MIFFAISSCSFSCPPFYFSVLCTEYFCRINHFYFQKSLIYIKCSNYLFYLQILNDEKKGESKKMKPDESSGTSATVAVAKDVGSKPRKLPYEDDTDYIPQRKQARELPMRDKTLTLKLSGCSKYFYDECIWARQQELQKETGIFSIKEFENMPCSKLSAFAVLCCSRGKESQVGWIKETDKVTFTNFAHNSDLEDLDVKSNYIKIRQEHKAVDFEICITRDEDKMY